MTNRQIGGILPMPIRSDLAKNRPDQIGSSLCKIVIWNVFERHSKCVSTIPKYDIPILFLFPGCFKADGRQACL